MPLLRFGVLLLFEHAQRWDLFNLNLGGGFYLRWELTFKVGPQTPLHTMDMGLTQYIPGTSYLFYNI